MFEVSKTENLIQYFSRSWLIAVVVLKSQRCVNGEGIRLCTSNKHTWCQTGPLEYINKYVNTTGKHNCTCIFIFYNIASGIVLNLNNNTSLLVRLILLKTEKRGN